MEGKKEENLADNILKENPVELPKDGTASSSDDRESMGVDDKLIGDDLQITEAQPENEEQKIEPEPKEIQY
ncbi:MAG: hypothetical protein WKI04_07895 [Ferruginibacter sp.]